MPRTVCLFLLCLIIVLLANPLKSLERAMGLEPTTLSLGIRLTDKHLSPYATTTQKGVLITHFLITLVDAIMAKRNTGTKMTNAPLVIGKGPGFYGGNRPVCRV